MHRCRMGGQTCLSSGGPDAGKRGGRCYRSLPGACQGAYTLIVQTEAHHADAAGV
jgi:hypothetical protein